MEPEGPNKLHRGGLIEYGNLERARFAHALRGEIIFVQRNACLSWAARNLRKRVCHATNRFSIPQGANQVHAVG